MASKPPKKKPLSHEAGGNHFTPEERAGHALSFISPDIDHSDWIRVGMALKSELGDSGFVMFDEWSKGGQSYQPNAARDAWKSFKASGPITIATLFHLAQEAGWKDDRPPPPPAPPDPKRIERERRAELKKKRDQASAAGNAAALWKMAKPCQAHTYLKAKGVKPVKGLRVMDASEAVRPGCSFGPGITAESGPLLLVPIYDETGALQTLEAITADGVKGLFAGGKKAGGFFPIGDQADPSIVYLAEGLATGLSIHQATGEAVRVTIDAGNLKAIAEITREKFKDCRLVMAGDLDESGTGQKKSKAAAVSVDGVAILPDFTAAEGVTWGDWNDLHQAIGADGVKGQIDAALSAHEAGKATDPNPDHREELPRSTRKQTPYSVNDSGTWHTDADGEKTYICAPLRVLAMTRNERGEAWGRLLGFGDPEGREHLWACPIKLLAGDGVAFREALMEQGLVISPAKAARAHLSIYVQTAEPGRFVHCAEQTGWTVIEGKRVFVTPDTTIGPDTGSTRVLYQGPALRGYGTRGDLASWQETIGRLCNGNSRLLLAVSMGFAGPLLAISGAEGGGVHVRGGSSIGKTSVLRVAVSVTGGPEALQRWRGTSNGLEGIACSHNDGLLVLDEMGQVSATEAGEIAYMLANGAEKLRGARTGGVREVRRWLLLFLSSGELGLADHMMTAGKRARAGQEVRLLDIPADTGKFGAFEDLHGHESGAAFSRAITYAAGQNYGSAFRAFVEKVAGMDAEELPLWLDLRRDRFIKESIISNDPSGQAIRAAHRFAIIAAAGELASQFGIVPWPDGAATWGAKVCFDAWLNARGGAGNQEPRDMLAQVRHFLEQHGDSRFTPWACERCEGEGKVWIGRDPNSPQFDKEGKPTIGWGDKHGTCNMCAGTGKVLQRTVNAAGYRKMVEAGLDKDKQKLHHRHFLVYPESWKVDVCAGFDAKAVTALLVERGVILKDTEGKAQQNQRPPGETPRRFYVVNFDAEGWEL